MLNGEDAEKIADDYLSFLTLAYESGIRAVSRMLDYEATVDMDDMYECIYMVIDGKTFEDRVREHIENEEGDNLKRGLMTLAESEMHRVYNTATYDGAKQCSDTEKVAIGKRWDTMMDDRVRSTHDYLEGAVVGLNDKFYTYDGDSAYFPGGFDLASNNVNCRCSVTYERI